MTAAMAMTSTYGLQGKMAVRWITQHAETGARHGMGYPLSTEREVRHVSGVVAALPGE
jgi:hypothetical protein